MFAKRGVQCMKCLPCPCRNEQRPTLETARALCRDSARRRPREAFPLLPVLAKNDSGHKKLSRRCVGTRERGRKFAPFGSFFTSTSRDLIQRDPHPKKGGIEIHLIPNRRIGRSDACRTSAPWVKKGGIRWFRSRRKRVSFRKGKASGSLHRGAGSTLPVGTRSSSVRGWRVHTVEASRRDLCNLSSWPRASFEVEETSQAAKVKHGWEASCSPETGESTTRGFAPRTRTGVVKLSDSLQPRSTFARSLRRRNEGCMIHGVFYYATRSSL